MTKLGNSLKKKQNNTPNLPLLTSPPEHKPKPHHKTCMLSESTSGMGGEPICSFFPGAGDSCVPSCGCLGKPDAGICRVMITPCTKERGLFYQYAAHLCTELQKVRVQLSPCRGGGVPTQVSRLLMLQPHRTFAKCTK